MVAEAVLALEPPPPAAAAIKSTAPNIMLELTAPTAASLAADAPAAFVSDWAYASGATAIDNAAKVLTILFLRIFNPLRRHRASALPKCCRDITPFRHSYQIYFENEKTTFKTAS
ncbi:hypothetical protein [Rheinheimera sp.]|uniref:hypothetical protein n=1 Tax=Rheinheimera sp. TaxID=1869214 RepID=UPI004047CE8A